MRTRASAKNPGAGMRPERDGLLEKELPHRLAKLAGEPGAARFEETPRLEDRRARRGVARGVVLDQNFERQLEPHADLAQHRLHERIEVRIRPPGFAMSIFSFSARSTIAPLASLMSVSLGLRARFGRRCPLDSPDRALPDSVCTNTVNMPATTAASISACV
jgi:hypothetical protein